MWVTYLGMVFFSITNMGAWAILMAFVLMLPLMGGMAFMWTMAREQPPTQRKATLLNDNDAEKRKRDRLDAVLRDLSDDQLLRLRQRLEDGTIDDDSLYEKLVGDDGELISRR